MHDDADGADTAEWLVLRNDEDQYSLWPATNAVPAGWQPVGPRGDKQLCLDYVTRTWTDMRPLSLRG